MLAAPGPVYNVKNRPYNAQGNGSSGDEAAIRAAADDVERVEAGHLYIPKGVYNVDLSGGEINFAGASFALDGLRISGDGPQATVLKVTSPNSGVQLRVSGDSTELASTTLSAVADGADVSLRVNSTTGFEAGQIIYIRDTSDSGANGSWPYDPRADQDNGEWLIIQAVDAGNSELDLVTPVQSTQSYPATDTEVKAITMTRNVVIEDLTLELGTVSSSYSGISIRYVDGLEINNVEIVGAGGAGLTLNSCVNFRINDVIIRDGDDGVTTTGYGLQTNQCQWGVINNPVIRHQRRAIDYSGAWPTRFVYTVGGVCEGSREASDRSVVGTHGAAEYCGWIGTTIIGGGSGAGVYVRGNRISIKNCSFYGTHGAAVLFSTGAVLEVTGCTMEGMKRWATGSGGRWVDEFVQVDSPDVSRVHLSGNIAHVETQHVLWHTTASGELWVEDQVIFRTGAPGTQRIVHHDESSGTLSLYLDCAVLNKDAAYEATAGGTITLRSRHVGTRYRELLVPPGAFSPDANATETIFGTASRQSPAYVFAEGSDTYISTYVKLPPDYNGENITATIRWTTVVNSSGGVVWRSYTGAIANGDAADEAAAESNSVVDAAPGTANDVQEATLITISSVTDTDWLRLVVRRNSGEASDTCTDDAYFLGVLLAWTQVV